MKLTIYNRAYLLTPGDKEDRCGTGKDWWGVAWRVGYGLYPDKICGPTDGAMEDNVTRRP